MNEDALTRTQIYVLAEKHVLNFSRLIDGAKAGRKGVRIAECEDYLRIWTSIAKKMLADGCPARPFSTLDSEERDEVEDAVESGDFERLLEEAAR